MAWVHHKKHGVKKMAKKNLVKKKEAHINIIPPKFRSISYHGKQCAICHYETSILDFGRHQKMAQSS